MLEEKEKHRLYRSCNYIQVDRERRRRCSVCFGQPTERFDE